jgi:hypothetical protein
MSGLDEALAIAERAGVSATAEQLAGGSRGAPGRGYGCPTPSESVLTPIGDGVCLAQA